MEWLILLSGVAAGAAVDYRHAWPADPRWAVGYAAVLVAMLVIVLVQTGRRASTMYSRRYERDVAPPLRAYADRCGAMPGADRFLRRYDGREYFFDRAVPRRLRRALANPRLVAREVVGRTIVRGLFFLVKLLVKPPPTARQAVEAEIDARYAACARMRSDWQILAGMALVGTVEVLVVAFRQ